MPKKRKKYPKLPNGFGTIRYIGGDRRNPFAVHPPAKGLTLNGSPNRPSALCYVDSWIKGFTVLTAYKAGNYTPGMERTLEIENTNNLEVLAQRIMADYTMIRGAERKGDVDEITFAEVYQRYFSWKYEQDMSKTYSASTIKSTKTAFKNCHVLHARPFRSLKHDDLQSVVNNCPLKHASLELIVSLFKQMYAYADIYELCDKDYSAHVRILQPDDDEEGIPFTEQDLITLWEHQDDDTVKLILIMCYSGYRIAAYKNLNINLDACYFEGGVKTKAGKNRIVPIHSSILPLVKETLHKQGCLIPCSISTVRKRFRATLEKLGLLSEPVHTPHDCRHTFSWLCEKYKVQENDRKRMLGHSFGHDITNAKYGHRTIEELREELEKIKTPVTNL